MKNFSKERLLTSLFGGLLALSIGCSGSSSQTEGEEAPPPAERSEVVRTNFGSMADGTPVHLFTLTNSKGTEVKVTNYGGIITSVRVPDKEGNVEDVVMGFDSLAGYLQEGVPYFGAVVGRYANRIAGGKFSLNGQDYTLVVNSGQNHLHGGNVGFDKVLWEASELVTSDGTGVALHYVSKDMEEGYPGKLDVSVAYILTEDNELKIDYEATTDKPTIVNLTNHSYFNLSGDMEQKILDHELMINAEQFVPVNEALIPTGELHSVEDTPLDFTEPVKIGKRIDADNEQLELGGGYDHCWVLKTEDSEEVVLAATVHEPVSGRFMEVLTTEPGVQLYTANFLNGFSGKEGEAYTERSALCLETQHFPDSPNQPAFPSTALNPGETYRTRTVYKFSVK